MLTIEIHTNMSRWSPWKDQIDSIIQEIGFGDDAVTTVIDSTPKSCGELKKMKTFIRVCCSDAGKMEKVIKAFKAHELGVDTQKLLLDGFIPAEEME